MAGKNDTNWHQNYDALKSYILQRRHLPDKHVIENRSLLSWAKYQRKMIKKGRWMQTCENCLRHYSPLGQQGILGVEGRNG